MQHISAFAYVCLMLFQYRGILAGLRAWFDWWDPVNHLLGLALGWVPIVGTIGAIWGAVEGWGWGWGMAAGAFLGALAAVLAVYAFGPMLLYRKR